MGAGGRGLVDKLHENTALFRSRMSEAGFKLKVRSMRVCKQLHSCHATIFILFGVLFHVVPNIE